MSRSRILIVEDEPGLSRSLSWWFNREGFEVCASADGLDSLCQAEAFLPDVVLLDVMLPGMNGFDVCRQLRTGTRTCGIRIVLMSACADREAQLAGYAAGADDFVPKPFSNKALSARVRAVLNGTGARPDPVSQGS